MSLVVAEEVAPPRSPCSTSTTFRPRPAASRAMPAPLMPPPTTARSKTSAKRDLRPLEEAVDERFVVIDAEAEPDAASAAVGEDAVRGKPGLDVLGAVEIEGEEVTARK